MRGLCPDDPNAQSPSAGSAGMNKRLVFAAAGTTCKDISAIGTMVVERSFCFGFDVNPFVMHI